MCVVGINIQVARVNAEMVRPDVSAPAWGGYDTEKFIVAGLARSTQGRFYIHSCSKKYCKEGRNDCRFFYPWPEQR